MERVSQFARQKITRKVRMMSRRSRRSKPFSMLGAFLIEAGTMLAFIALAQPTWTRSLIEQVTNAPVATSTSSAATHAVANIPQSTELQQAALSPLTAPTLLDASVSAWSNSATDNTATNNAARNNFAANNNTNPQGWQPSSTTSYSPPWSDTTERVAQANWSSSRLSAAEVRYAPQVPVYPPSNWSSSY